MRFLHSALAVLLLSVGTLLWVGAERAVPFRAPDVPAADASPVFDPDASSLYPATDANPWPVRSDQLVFLPHQHDVLRQALRLAVVDVDLHVRSSPPDDARASLGARLDLVGRDGAELAATNVPELGTAWLVLIGLGILCVPRLRPPVTARRVATLR